MGGTNDRKPITPRNTGDNRDTASKPAPDGGEGGPLPPVPPEWVRLRDAPGVIERVCGVPAADIGTALVLGVRDGELRRHHRIPGVAPAWPRPGSSSDLPPGLDWKRTPFGNRDGNRIMAADWEAAETDWAEGTVGGWKRRWGARERLPIEVRWTALVAFVANHAVRAPERRPEKPAPAQAPDAAPPADVAPPSAAAPLPAAVDWLVAYAEAHIARHGVPCKRDAVLRACQREAGFTYREARAAWTALPAQLRRAPRSTDRTLAKR